MPAPWPPGFERVPGDDWVGQRTETLALTYDTVQDHGWYRNLDPTVERLVESSRQATSCSTTRAVPGSSPSGCSPGCPTRRSGS